MKYYIFSYHYLVFPVNLDIKPYWDENLSFQWKKVCESEKIWLRLPGANSMKRKLKEEYCIQRKTFDRLNRKYKVTYSPFHF
jgi:hypothetical protein